MKHLVKKLSILVFLISGVFPAAAQSIGPQRGEMYFLLEWYFESWQPSVSGLFYTTDHGRHFAVIDTFANNPSWFPFGAGFVMADATPGVLYRLTESDFFLSVDQANTWQDLNQSYPFADYATGNQPNEIYRRSNNMLFKSADNGTHGSLKMTVSEGDYCPGINLTKSSTIQPTTLEIQLPKKLLFFTV